MRKVKQTGWAPRFEIVYVKGDRQLRDSATTLEGAKARIEARFAKRHNYGERADVYLGRDLVLQINGKGLAPVGDAPVRVPFFVAKGAA